jgi:molybdenum cofactor synthesis domain-containing protein
MTTSLEVLSLNVSPEKGTVKHPVFQVAVDELGIVGDAHAGRWHRQVSLLAQESIDRFSAELGRAIGPGEFGENVTFRGPPSRGVSPLDRLILGGVELEVTQIGKQCHGSGCVIFQQAGKCVMPAEGLFARVVRKGVIRRGDGGEHRPRAFHCLVVTLSDRASAGAYEDHSGPRVRELLDEFFAERSWHYSAEQRVLPDDPEQLRREILLARDRGVDLIITTGGTGVGPRDITPETIVPLCDKLIPGIIEHLRARFGRDNPRARLSRAVAGVMGTTQIYALPGSVRAVEEYLPEILATLEHLVYMLHGLDVHRS